MKKALILFTAVLIAGTFQDAEAQPEREVFVLAVEVWSQGQPVPSAEVELGQGESLLQTALTDSRGMFNFEVAPGLYRLTVRMPGFYETTLSDVAIEAQPLNSLILHLSPHLRSQEHEPLVKGPEEIPAPDLQLRFAADPPIAQDQVMTGRVTVTNAGEASIQVPRDSVSGRTNSEPFLRMNLVVVVRGYQAIFNGWYSCLPPHRCVELAPSESIDYPVTLFKRSGQHDQPQAYHRTGEYPVAVALSFIPAGEPNKRTETIEATYLLRVEW